MAWSDEIDALNNAVQDAFGFDVTITKYTAGAYNTTTGVVTRTSAATTLKAERLRSSIDVVKGKRIESVIYRILASDMAVPPNADDTLTDGTKVFSVVTAAPSVDATTFDVTVKRTVLE